MATPQLPTRLLEHLKAERILIQKENNILDLRLAMDTLLAAREDHRRVGELLDESLERFDRLLKELEDDAH